MPSRSPIKSRPTSSSPKEEKIRARDQKLKLQEAAKNAQMAKLYREVVLKEQKPEGGFVSIDNLIATANKPKAEEPAKTMGD